MTESKCLEVVSPETDFFSMVLLSEVGQRRRRHGLISPTWSSPVKANFKRGLCWMTMNLSFSAGDCLDGTGETLLRPWYINKKSPRLVRPRAILSKIILTSHIALRTRHCNVRTQQKYDYKNKKVKKNNCIKTTHKLYL